MLLAAMPVALDGLGAVDGRLDIADRFQGLVQDRLVGCGTACNVDPC
jgi:hypothetical protein